MDGMQTYGAAYTCMRLLNQTIEIYDPYLISALKEVLLWRFKLLKLYLKKYLGSEGEGESKWGHLFKKKSQKITIKDLSDDVIREAARKTEGFSGREIAKLMASVQAAVYGRPDCVLDSNLFKEIVEYKVAEHHQRIKLASEA
ncbi:UNVERIFIED_CONTAM: hypothetical protein Scaly_2157500 [Sesamum calycinum]|uniref:AAA ATPase AAA+ lid domain-containing protein n=1 Tax=Sesamum calycinum TaxID=2727403 RepID=A0AAW2MP93_9LAMI